MKFCGKCGSENEEDAIYCKDCGNKLYKKMDNHKNIKKLVLLVGSVALIILGVILSKDDIMYKYYVAKGNTQVQSWKAVEYYTEALKLDYNQDLLVKIKGDLLNSDSYSTSLLKSLENVLSKYDFDDLYIEVYAKEAQKAFESDDYESCIAYLKKAEEKGYDINQFLYIDQIIEKDNENYSDYNSEEDDNEYIINEYIIYDSDVRYLSRNELMNYSKSELGYIRNEIFARHGYIFKTKKYSDYFSDKSWYVPNPDATGTEADLNDVEKANVELIKGLE